MYDGFRVTKSDSRPISTLNPSYVATLLIDLAIWHDRLGKSVDEICAEYALSLAEIHAALAYYTPFTS
jgi:hypothetical protein